MSETIIRVVSGILYRDGKILTVQRRSDQRLAGKWYLAGGKVEDTDLGDRTALARELDEELGLKIVVIQGEIANVQASYVHGTFDVHFYRISHFEGEPRNTGEHAAIKWIREWELIRQEAEWLEDNWLAARLFFMEKRHF